MTVENENGGLDSAAPNAEPATSVAKVVLVTGGSSGLGAAVVRRMLALGWRVAVVGRTPEHLRSMEETLEGQGEAIFMVADVSSEVSVTRVFEAVHKKWGRLDAVVNAAGQVLLAPCVRTSLEDWKSIMDTNATGTFLICREAVKLWAAAKQPGAIVNVSSVSARIGAPLTTAYVAAKAAVLGFTRALAKETAGKGIRVNAVCPGAMDTPMFHEGTTRPLAAMCGRDCESLVASTVEVIPMRRLLDADEVASMVVYLLGEEASGITGQAFNVDGGYDMR